MDVMFDLETLGTASNAIILTVAAVVFEPTTGKVHKAFYRKVNLESYKSYLRDFSYDASTLIWWMNKAPQEARLEAFGTEADQQNRNHIQHVMEELVLWIGAPGKVWSHGASFDIPILENALRVSGLDVPWKFWNIRDTRTIYDLGNVVLKCVVAPGNTLPAHHALGDCYNQIEGVRLALENLKSKTSEKQVKRLKVDSD